jgi:transposase
MNPGRTAPGIPRRSDPARSSRLRASSERTGGIATDPITSRERPAQDARTSFRHPHLDVPAKLSARVRVLDNERSDKNDSHDARSAAIVALRNRKLCAVALEDHAAVLRMLAKRHHELTGLRTQAICRLHAVLATMIEGGLPRKLSADRAALELRRLRPTDAVGHARRQVAVEHLADVRRLDRMLVELRPRIVGAVALSETTVTDVYGIITEMRNAA